MNNKPTLLQREHDAALHLISRLLRDAATTHEVNRGVYGEVENILTRLERVAQRSEDETAEESDEWQWLLFHAPRHRHVYYPFGHDQRLCTHCDGVWVWSTAQKRWVLLNEQQGPMGVE